MIAESILIVEDEPWVAQHLDEMLRSRGYAIAGLAATCADAVRIARESAPGLVIMDVLLRGEGDGIEAARLIQQDADVPVVYITASTDEENLDRAFTTNPYGYLVKPIKEFDLYFTIETALNRSRLERRLKKSEAFSAALLENALVPIFVLNPDSTVRYVNRAMEEITGWTADELLGTGPPFPWWPAESGGDSLEELSRSMKDAPVKSGARYRKKSGESFWVDTRFSAVTDKGEVLYYITCWADETPKKKLQAEILNSAERERIRTGQVLHDGVGQEIAGISYMLRGMSNRAGRGEAVTAEEFDTVTDMIDRAKNGIRLVARGLYPVTLGRDGLFMALEDMAAGMEKIYGVKCSLFHDEIAVYNTQSATHIFHIIQEAARNAATHGGAGVIDIDVLNRGAHVEITVRDNGRGFGGPAAGGSGMGIDLMRYRCELMGGSFRVETSPGEGTRVSCAVPLSSLEKETEEMQAEAAGERLP